MLRDSIAILSSTQPPSPKAVKQAVADANALICAMETELGLPHRYPVLTSTMAIKRLKELEAMKAANLSGTSQAPVSIETELGSSYHHLTQASARSAALVEQIKARKQSKLPDSSLAPTTTPPSTLTVLPPAAASSSAAPLNASKSPAISTDRLSNLCAHLFGAESVPTHLNPVAARAEMERKLRFAGVAVSGLNDLIVVSRTGVERATQARLQEKANKFLNSNS